MTPMVALSSAAMLLALPMVAVSTGRAVTNSFIYGLCAAGVLISLFVTLKRLLGGAPAESL
jgi:hypothetical protein